MAAFLWTALSGWIAVFVLAGVACLPYALRTLRIAGGGRAATLRWHYLLGASVPALSFIHAWAPMSASGMRGLDSTGIWLASAALAFLFLQLALGIELRDARLSVWLRRSHISVMIAAVALIGVHIALNRA